MSDELHHRLSPSSAHRWLDCPGSVALAEAHGLAGKDSDAASEGRLAHEVFAAMLLGEPLPEAPEDMVALLRPGADTILAHVEATGGHLYVERAVPLGRVIPGGFGRADVIVTWVDDCGPQVWVIDLKYGMVRVDPSHNPQAMLYAIGAMDDLCDGDPPRVLIGVFQPRAGGWRRWSPCPGDLAEFAARVAAAEPLTHNPTALSPTARACEYCPAKGVCPALAASMPTEIAENSIASTPAMPEATTVAPDRVATILSAKNTVEKWLASIYEAARDKVLAGGQPPPGLKLVAGRLGTRAWADHEAAKEALVGALGEAAWEPRKLVSPATAEKLLGKGSEAMPATVQFPTAPVFVPEADKRPALGAPALPLGAEGAS